VKATLSDGSKLEDDVMMNVVDLNNRAQLCSCCFGLGS
jgi:hypothetical protein